jgi:hypothetical protein
MDKAHIMFCFLVLPLIFSGCGEENQGKKQSEKQP